MRRAIAAAALVALVGCTPAETRAWIAWHEADPEAAVAFAQQLPPEPIHESLTNAHAAAWERIAWCESGSNWSMHVRNRYGWFGGALAIKDTVWAHYGGRAYAAHAGLASKAQQIDIAERILADVGFRAWQCAS